VPLPLDRSAEAADADAVLLIATGPCAPACRGSPTPTTLGQEWHDWNGLPFVYAFWAVREGPNLARWSRVARGPAARLRPHRHDCHQERRAWGWTPVSAAAYLQSIIHFDLGRPSWPACTSIIGWPASWAWPAGGEA